MATARLLLSASLIAVASSPPALAQDWEAFDQHAEGTCGAMLFPTDRRPTAFVVQFHREGRLILTYSEPNLPKTNQEVFRVEVHIGNSPDVAIGMMTDVDIGTGKVRGISVPMSFETPSRFFETRLGVALMSGNPLRFSVPVMKFSYSVPTAEFPTVAEKLRDCLSKIR